MVASIMSEYYLWLENQQVGPLTEEKVRGLISANQANDDTPAWKEGLAEWSTVKDLGLGKPKLAARKPAPQPAAPAPEPVFAQVPAQQAKAERASRPKATFGERIKMLFVGIFFLPIAAGIFVYGVKAPDYYRLSRSGKETQAKITSYDPYTYRRRGMTSTTHYHHLEYQGHSVKLDLGMPREVGSEITILYLPGDPEVIAMGKQGDDFWKIVDKNPGLWLFLGVSGIGVMFAVLGLIGVYGFLTGVKPKNAS